ncbi:spore germination protein [Clostridium bowmanii]|uniref:GerAB/ArcD/ProY family transporter n=1 Tax=Clostridium bowmanii TaxID=132925 RepID=UPI001C0ADCB4|nr:endospore germination permease [Clostridium bowmanii]MBU3190209.1 spore germination protein [Clostridium bowmanii]MCA1074816.1 spore germination protein [Clostridium bowmanii]
MKKVGSNDISPGEFTFLLIGSMIGVGILSLPNDLVVVAKQDAWISAFIGAVYPLYMVIIASILCKIHPKKNILVLSKICFGKFIGNILNIIFLLYFVLFTTSIAFQVSLIKWTLIVSFLSLQKILIVILALAAYTATKGLKILARVNQLMFILTILLSIILCAALFQGNYLNIFPILGSGVLNIVKASQYSAFAFGGIEIIFLIYPFITDKTKVMKASIKGVLITAIIYAWITFITIYYVGIDIIPKMLWSVNMVAKTVRIPTISNFKFVFVVIWALIICKTIANNYFATAFILKDFFKKTEIKKIVYIIYPLIFYLSLKYSNLSTATSFLNFITPKYVLFNVAYVTIITLIIYVKKGQLK